MVFISRLKLRNFKSFKAADVQLSKTFICFAGPNGSGKSNLCDAIRFAMGETSLRSLRAKKVRDLIFSGSKSAEVTLIFEDDGGGRGTGYEIKRAIREDGKIRYRLNGKRTTRSTIHETLRRHNLDESGRNTIAQGEVQRIISMNGKERRAIIDSVAGIAEFEAKKKEAMGELQTVDDRIREARVVLGERKVFLDELGREKDVALKYIDAKKTLTNAKGTILKAEVEKLEKDLSEALRNEEKLLAVKSARDSEMAGIEAKISEVDSRRAKTSEMIAAKQKTNALIRRLEELKASVGSKKQLIEDKEGALITIRKERKALAEEMAADKEAVAALGKEIEYLRAELAKAESALAAAGGAPQDEVAAGIRKELGEREDDLRSAKERLVLLASEMEAKGELIAAKKEEERSITPKESEGAEAPDDAAALKREIERLAREIDRSFSRTKEINAQMADLDRDMLELKEKASIFKVRASPQLANPALSFISEIMKERGAGIYGTVADLVSFDAEYASAVEAAGGARLLYVVVDCVDTATQVIDKLKKAKAGRATFIPLDSIRTPQPARAGGFASVIEAVTFREEVRRAVEYVFADTLLVETVSDAKRLGIGTGRMVTKDGEIFERSGIVSGGRSQSGVLGANALRKIENELEGVKSTKESMMQELYSIREGESRLRGEKAQLEIRLKTLEMQQRIGEERRKEQEQTLRRKEQLAREIEALSASLAERSAEKERLAALLGGKEREAEHYRRKLEAAEAEFRTHAEESSRKKADLSAAASSLKAKMEGRQSEINLHNRTSAQREERARKLAQDEKEAQAKVAEVTRQIKDDEAELAQTEEKISSVSKEIEGLFEEMKAYENDLQELGRKRGLIRLDLDKNAKDMNLLTVKKATASTRLEDIRAEFSAYSGAEFIEAPKDELNRMVAESETMLASLGNVNMAAIEMFDRRKAEIDEVEGKIGKLDTEREAILGMISEIDEHKKDAFFETYNAVSDNFSKLFKHISVGQGHLALSDAADPFESGLFIKLRRNNQEHALDALSGGEKTLVALMFIFALQLFKPAPFYILDEVDAALDKPNSKNLADLVASLGADSQFIIVTHNDTVMSNSDSVIGVTKADGTSKLVGIKLKQAVAQAQT
ncbi:AAA family ATPase [Candidatus Micrarchaeota archaeon]|nr:AAA family ATPase [Candidatus Micrarchaeota archaeon]